MATTFECSVCGRTFKTDSGRNWHRERAHPDERAKMEQPDPNAHWTEAEVREELEALQALCSFNLEEQEKKDKYIRELEERVRDVPELRRKITELEAQINHMEKAANEAIDSKAQTLQVLDASRSAHAQMEQKTFALRINFSAETERRVKAEQERDDAIQQLADSKAHAVNIALEMEKLEHLRIWDGFACKVCGQPMSGSVTREDAAKVMSNFVHGHCQSPNESKGKINGGLILLGLAVAASVVDHMTTVKRSPEQASVEPPKVEPERYRITFPPKKAQ